MQLKELLAIARERGVDANGLSKPDLIRAIQRAEGSFDCFGSAAGDCSQKDCLWIRDCIQADKGV